MSLLAADQCCEQWAERQHGVFRRSQAVACGLTHRSIEHRLTSGRWLKVLTGVYCIRGTRLVWETMLMAACLWSEGFVSHRAAARLWNLDGVHDRLIEVSSRLRRRPPPGIIVHRTRCGSPLHTVRYRGFTVTDPTSTLIDLAGVLDPTALEKALDSALRQRLTYPALILSRLDEVGSRGRRGTAILRTLIRERIGGASTDSPLEIDAKNFLDSHGFRPPKLQHWVTSDAGERRRLDFAWPEVRVGIEVDSHEWHEGFESLERDAARGNFYVDLDWKVLRLTRLVMRTQGATFIRKLGRLLGQAELKL
ncbi:MAG: type IV toxin-antitoxin system AbiEi family antitoxin domain-containing protein [Actinomycetota bacterium]